MLKSFFTSIMFILLFCFSVSKPYCFAQNIDSLFNNKPKTKKFQTLSVEGHSLLYGLLRSDAYLRKFNNPVLVAPVALKDYFNQQKIQINQLLKPAILDSAAIKLAFVGDIMWLRNNWGNFIDSAVYAKLSNCDLVFGNLETIIDTTKKVNCFWPDYRTYNSDKQLLNFLQPKKAVLSVANNHCLDKGLTSLQNTIALLQSKGIYHNGLKTSSQKLYTLVSVKGIKIGFYACTWGVNNPKDKFKEELNLIKGIAPFNRQPLANQEAEKALKQMADDGIDFKIIYVHWGYEYEFYPRQNTMKLARTLAQAGADIIIGAHPHVFQPAELIYTAKDSLNYHTTLVNYSLGNFCTSMYSTETRLGLIENISLIKDKNGKISFTCPTYTYVYNAPHLGNRKRKLLLLDDFIKLYPKEANKKFKLKVSKVISVLE